MGMRTNSAVWIDSRNRWQINVQKDGVRKTFTCSRPGKNGKIECHRKADAWLDDGVGGSVKRVQDAYNEWMAELQQTTSRSNWRSIESRWKNGYEPAIGTKKISALTDNDFQKVINAMASAGKSRKTLQNFCADARAFCKFCRRSKYSSLNPEFLNIPAGARLKGKMILQPNEIAKLMRADNTFIRGKTQREEYICAYRFALLTGLRPGELIGLRWDDIDGNIVKVQRAVNYLGEVTKGKNENAVRAFAMPDMAMAVLEEQRKFTGGGDSVFGILNEQALYRHWKTYCAVNDITAISIYELRHSFVSAVKTLPAGEIKSLVGHSASMDTFGTYSHALNGDAERTAKSVNGVFETIVDVGEKYTL